MADFVHILNLAKHSLNEGVVTTTIADAESIPVSVSQTSLKKITWANLKTALKTSLYGSISGIVKLNGSAVLSAATAGTDYVSPSLQTTFTDATACSSQTTGAVVIAGGLGVGGDIRASNIYGAVWNDYAEFRECPIPVELGRVVIEDNTDSVWCCDRRLSKSALVSSDTFGMAIGNQSKSSIAIAVAGRALVWTDKNKKHFKPGDVVCSGTYGTVSKMKWYEKILFPDRIIGIVSCVPTYTTWGEGNVEVKDRIWIRVR